MAKLISLAQGENEQTMSSIQLVEIINEYRKIEGNYTILIHSDFMKKIVKELNGGEGNFSSTYLDKSNRQTKCYKLPKYECMLMLMSESRTVRKGVLDRLSELELNQNKPTYENKPSYQIENPINRAKAWILEYEQKAILIEEKTLLSEENVVLIEENSKLQEKSDFMDVCCNTDSLFSMEETAKILKLGFGRNTMLKELRNLKILLSSNTPGQAYINAGYFKVMENLINIGSFNRVVSTTYATHKGLEYLGKIFKEKNLRLI